MLHTQNENLQAQRAWNQNARSWDERMADGNHFFNVLIWPAVNDAAAGERETLDRPGGECERGRE